MPWKMCCWKHRPFSSTLFVKRIPSDHSLPIAYGQHDYRKRIDTVGSLIERMLPNTIHAVTAEGFELKVFLCVLAYNLNCL
jgi:hypothetical protein